MLKRLRIPQGIHIALIIAFIMAIPRFIRFENTSLNNILILFVYMFLFNLALWVNCQYFLKHKYISKNMARLLLALAAGSVISAAFQILGERFIPYLSQEEIRLGLTEMNRNQKILMYLFRGCASTGLLYFIVYNISLIEEKQKNKLEIERLKQENLEARLSLLKQQISPHFLFNSLSTLKTIATDSKTKNYIIQLANVYRYLLTNKNYQGHNLVSLTDELAFTKSYLYILKERFEDALQVSIEVDDKQKGKYLPPLALQILIENAIKHNIVSLDEPLRIKIYNEGENFLVVENKLQLKISTEDSLGLGLQNIKDRYKILKDKEILIVNTQNSFIVKIPLLE